VKVSTKFLLRSLLWAAFSSCIVLNDAQILFAASYTVKTIALPGQGGNVTDINNAGQITGQYGDSTGIHGFIGNPNPDGTFTFSGFDVPGSTATQPNGINKKGQIVGSYTSSGNATQGFIREPDGTIRTLNAPNTLNIACAVLIDINDFGDIVGSTPCSGGIGNFVRLLNPDGTVNFVPVQISNISPATAVVSGINNARQVVGSLLICTIAAFCNNHEVDPLTIASLPGFIWDASGSPVQFFLPAGAWQVTTYKANNSGQTLLGATTCCPPYQPEQGTGRAGTAVSLGFYLRESDGTFTHLDGIPSDAFQLGLNDLGEIVGKTLGQVNFIAVPVGVTFVGFSNPLELDSGFDGTNVGRDSGSLRGDTPAIVSVAVGQTTSVVTAKIPPTIPPGEVTFSNTQPSIASFSSRSPRQAEQVLSIKGLSFGIATIQTFRGSDLLGELKVVVYPQRTKQGIAASPAIVQMMLCDSPLVVPLPQNPLIQKTITAKQLEDGVNKIFDQAAVRYNFRTISDFTGKKAIDVDTDRDCTATALYPAPAPQTGFLPHPDLIAIDKKARDPKADVNIYFVQRLGIEDEQGTIVPFMGYSIRYYTDIPVVLVVGARDQTEHSTVAATAHELGHDLGLPHCTSAATIDNFCAGDEKKALMHVDFAEGPGGLLLHYPEWDCANLGIKCGLSPYLNP
jgi:hypothetical protein